MSAERSSYKGRPFEPDPVKTGVGRSFEMPSFSDFRGALCRFLSYSQPSFLKRACTDAPLSSFGYELLLTNGHLRYQQNIIFDQLEFSLPAQKWTCLLGPSGVGKSSLIRLLAGLHDAAFGQVSCIDHKGQSFPPLGHVAYMAQKDGLLPWLSVIDNVTLGARLRGRKKSPEARRLAENLLEDVGLSNVAAARPEALSGGMRQRVALARTLFEDRPIILLDEPFSALDALTRIALQDLFAKLLKGRTVLLVTHDPLEALRLADKVMVLSGRPASMMEALYPQGHAPRPTDAPDILTLQGQLLRQLAGDTPYHG